MKKDQRILIDYLIEKGDKAYDDAVLLIENKSYAGAVNRVYYSCFYIVSALLLTLDLSAKTHKGVQSLFYKNFVENGIIYKEQSRFYSELLNLRQHFDYDFYLDIEPEKVEEVFVSAKEFIKIIKEKITC